MTLRTSEFSRSRRSSSLYIGIMIEMMRTLSTRCYIFCNAILLPRAKILGATLASILSSISTPFKTSGGKGMYAVFAVTPPEFRNIKHSHGSSRRICQPGWDR